MTVAIPAAALLTIALFVTIRYFGHRLSHAALAFVAGFLVATTAAAPTIRAVIDTAAHTIAKL